MIYIKYCEKCGEAFDVGINKNECPVCRLIKQRKEDENDLGNKR